ncbi:MAG: hypothetical protein ACLQBK_01520 [Candidatus Sulfotelmatobacter sp.]
MGTDYVAMHLFHHIVVFSLSEQEKRAFVEAGVEFTRTVNTSRGETVMFDIGENDPGYEGVAALLRSLDPKRVSDFSMTVPTLREWIAKMVTDGRERLKQEAAVQAQWPRGIEVLRESLEFMTSGKKEQALNVLDPAIAEAIEGNHSSWVLVLSRHAATLSLSVGDRERQIHYEQQALPFAKDYRFAAYNFAQLLLRDGQLVSAERYATEAYRQSMTQASEADSDLRAAILKQWPNVAEST